MLANVILKDKMFLHASVSSKRLHIPMYMNIIYYIQIHGNEIILINLENRLQHVTSRSRIWNNQSYFALKFHLTCNVIVEAYMH